MVLIEVLVTITNAMLIICLDCWIISHGGILKCLAHLIFMFLFCASQDNITYPSAHFFLIVLINSSVTQILHMMTIIVSVGLECVNEQRLCARDEFWFDILEFCLRHACLCASLCGFWNSLLQTQSLIECQQLTLMIILLILHPEIVLFLKMFQLMRWGGLFWWIKIYLSDVLLFPSSARTYYNLFYFFFLISAFI